MNWPGVRWGSAAPADSLIHAGEGRCPQQSRSCAGQGTYRDTDGARAMEHDSPKLQFRLACEFLISGRVARPGVIHLLGVFRW